MDLEKKCIFFPIMEMKPWLLEELSDSQSN